MEGWERDVCARVIVHVCMLTVMWMVVSQHHLCEPCVFTFSDEGLEIQGLYLHLHVLLCLQSCLPDLSSPSAVLSVGFSRETEPTAGVCIFLSLPIYGERRRESKRIVG